VSPLLLARTKDKAPAEQTDRPVALTSGAHITFGQDVKEPRSDSTLYIPPPRERDEGKAALQSVVPRNEPNSSQVMHSLSKPGLRAVTMTKVPSRTRLVLE
jgi:hypothetical protein